MNTNPNVCIHGGLRRKCEICELGDRLEAAEAQVKLLTLPDSNYTPDPVALCLTVQYPGGCVSHRRIGNTLDEIAAQWPALLAKARKAVCSDEPAESEPGLFE